MYFRHPNRALVQEHVKGHYRDEDKAKNNNNNSPSVEITPIYNTTNNNIVGGLDANLLLASSKTLSSFLASQNLLPIIQAAVQGSTNNNNNNNNGQPNANGIVNLSSGGGAGTGVGGIGTVDGNGGVVGGGNQKNSNPIQGVLQQLPSVTATAIQPQGVQLSPPGLIGTLTGASNNSFVKILPKGQQAQQQSPQTQLMLGANTNATNVMVSPRNKPNPPLPQTTGSSSSTATPQKHPQQQVNNLANSHSNDHGEMEEASSGGTTVGHHNYRSQLSYRCGHCQQVSNWKHVIQVFTNNWSFGVLYWVAGRTAQHACGGELVPWHIVRVSGRPATIPHLHKIASLTTLINSKGSIKLERT